MSLVEILKQWFAKPPAQGAVAIGGVIAAVAIPTVIRISVDHAVSGVAFSPYLPFVLLSALLMSWRHAGAVAVASAALADMLFIEPRFIPLAGPTDTFGIAIFLACSALIIIVVQSARLIIANLPGPVPNAGKPAGIIFSLEKGEAWASWSGAGSRLKLGPECEVAEMMEDFLAQRELGQRLTGTTA